MTYPIIRFREVWRIRKSDVKSDSVHCAQENSTRDETSGLTRPWEFPRMGVTGSTEWANALIAFRGEHARKDGAPPSFTPPRLGRRCGECDRAPATLLYGAT